MQQDRSIQYWVELANYDLETAKVMLEGQRFLYVGFMCHQVVEKIIKAYYVYHIKDTPPYIHNLTSLARKANLYDGLTNEQKDLLDLLEPLNVEARYPTHKERLAQALTQDRCLTILQKTKEFLKWIKQKL